MDRLIVAVVAGAALSLSFAEISVGQSPGQPGGPSGAGAGQGNAARPFRPARERWRNMSQEDRQRFRSNAERWLQLPPEERRQLREREGWRRERIRREAEAALQNSGLQLEAEKRELYERRYMEERRRIERALRQELQEKRQRELAPVMERLKKEFAQPQGSASPATSASASPTK